MDGSASASFNTGSGTDGRWRVPSHIGEAGQKNPAGPSCIRYCSSRLSKIFLARIENDKVEMEYTVSNVHECFENCVIMFQQQAESKNQTISLTEQIMYPYVYMDEPHLSEVCLNIISNAIKYTNTGGWISCNVVQKSCEKEDWCNMIISITDNGIGYKKPPVWGGFLCVRNYFKAQTVIIKNKEELYGKEVWRYNSR